MTRKRKSFAAPVPDFGAPFKCGGTSRLLRWCENPDSYMRRVGFADDVIRSETGRRHTCEGYYIDSFQDEVARGVVFKLAHGRGFVAGIADPHNDGPAMLAVCEAPEGTALEAARYADNLAESYAEAEREYREAFQAGSSAGDAWREAMNGARGRVMAAQAARLEARDAATLALSLRGAVEAPPSLQAEARAAFRASLETAREALAEACEARREAWRAFRDAVPTYDRDLRAAFMEGAGL